MRARTSIIDWSGNYEENCIQLGKHLGRSKIRRKLFDAIYGRTSKPRSKPQMMEIAGIKEGDGQQAQNELDYLASKGLIQRIPNGGSVEGRFRFLYCKDENVRSHRADILKFADNPARAKTTPTKRRPAGVTDLRTVTRQVLKKKKRLNVLYLTANPDEKAPLRVDAEMRQVQNAVRGSKLRDNIELRYRPAADLDSLVEGLNDHTPGIVHFSGHGNSNGIAVDHAKVARPSGKFLSFDLLSRAIASVDTPPQVIVLNSCYSAGARKTLLPNVRAIIAMSDSIGDLAATAFAAKFYAAIAAGQSLKSAFGQGKLAVEAVSLNEVDTPELILADGVNATKIILA